MGVAGLDDVLVGGLRRGRLYLLEGAPGAGKTTLATQFLLEGVARGERCLYITLSETTEELKEGAASHGWSLDGLEIFELVPPESLLDDSQRQSLLYSSDLELGETTRLVFEQMDRLQPQRVVLDSLSEIRLLAQSSLRYRRQILAMKHHFARFNSTVLMLDDMTADAQDKTVHSVAHGVIRLEELAPNYGAQRRRLRVTKYRGQAFRGGFHDFNIHYGGIQVYPRLVASEHHGGFTREQVSTGVAELDRLLGGGLELGASVLVLGPAGCGKTLMCIKAISTALATGRKAALYLFDEDADFLIKRCAVIGLDLQPLIDTGRLLVQQVDAAEVSPGEFAHGVRHCVEKLDVDIVLVDSLNGYQASMPEEQDLILHMHELLSFLNRRGVLTLLTVAQHGLVGEMRAPVELTYLSDTVVLLRFFEAFGRVRRAISVVKKRASGHEDTIRELFISGDGLRVGEPLADFQGVLRGVPEFVGTGRAGLIAGKS